MIDEKKNSLFVEVIFRQGPELFPGDKEKLERLNEFWDARLILVSCRKPPHFRISYPPYFDKDNKLVLKPLLGETDWKIDKDVYDIFEELVQKYLTYKPTCNRL